MTDRELWIELKTRLGAEAARVVVDLIQRLIEKHKEEMHQPKAKRAKREYPELFEKWYAVYPRKVAPDAALKAWAKRNFTEADLPMLIEAVEVQKKTEWKGREMDKIPHPSTWLNQGRWKNEVVKPKEVGPKLCKTCGKTATAWIGNECMNCYYRKES